MRKLSVCITTYNRCELTLKCFEDILDDVLVDEIVIVDDASYITIFMQLQDAVKNMSKVKLYRNEKNLDCYANKKRAVELATNEWAVLFDSDNILTQEYISHIYAQAWTESTILAPVWAMPVFDYREFAGLYITKHNVASYMSKNMFATALNTCNYFVNRDEYIKCFNPDIDPHSSDSIYMACRWLEVGNNIHFVDGLVYDHTIHDQSHYKLNCHKSPEFYEEIENKLKNMN